MQECRSCGRQYVYEKKKGHTRSLCNSCIVNKFRSGFKKKCVEYLSGKCMICGYNKCLAALHFHHRDPKIKDFEIGAAHCRAWDKIKEELDKCDLLCANCHFEVHNQIAVFQGTSSGT